MRGLRSHNSDMPGEVHGMRGLGFRVYGLGFSFGNLSGSLVWSCPGSGNS